MKIRNHIILPAICCALALTLGACGEEKKEDVKAEIKTQAEDVLNFSEDGKTVTGVKDKSIKSVVIPSGVTSIEWGAFSYCSNLTRITIPDSVTSIGNGAFWWCSSLSSITIPDTVTSIGDFAFSSVQSVQVSTQNPVFSVDGSGVLINKKEKKLLYAPPSLSGNYTIPDSVTSIGECAFWRCSSLTSITIPDSVTSIGDSAFEGCSNLTSITIPDSVTSIGDRAFLSCKNLTNITIPSGVKSIGGGAFSFCSNLTSVTIPDSVTSIGKWAFLGCSNLTSITIPAKFTDVNVKSWNLPLSCKIIRK